MPGTERGGCPYSQLPASAFWKRTVALHAHAELDPVVAQPSFRLNPEMRIATAGSCFAQHISAWIKSSGFNYMVTEPGVHFLPAVVAKRFNYGTFSARFGNLYTARQLRQLIERAYGSFVPVEPFWPAEGARAIDPFRPQIQPNGFASVVEARVDRAAHMRAVRRMIEDCDLFIFTLGLTEAWECVADGAVLPVCPGCGAGTFDAGRYRFRNYTVREVTADLEAAIELLRARNPTIRILLTVSPVPLIATASGQHVLQANTHSKSVLRAVAGELAASMRDVDYFPSYEIITSPAARGSYFADDLREIRPEGVAHVMSVFFRHYMEGEAAQRGPTAPQLPSSEPMLPWSEKTRRLAATVCDEEILEQMREV